MKFVSSHEIFLLLIPCLSSYVGPENRISFCSVGLHILFFLITEKQYYNLICYWKVDGSAWREKLVCYFLSITTSTYIFLLVIIECWTSLIKKGIHIYIMGINWIFYEGLNFILCKQLTLRPVHPVKTNNVSFEKTIHVTLLK